MEDGLSHPGTFYRESMLQDQEGFLWISTLNGLNRFDGKTFKLFQFDESKANSINSNLVTGICEADDGKIWAGTPAGINIFDPQFETFELLQHESDNPNSLCGNGINFIRKDQKGNMWIGTQTNGICRYAIETNTFDNFGDLFQDGLVFFQQENGTIWLGNHDGLFKYLPDNNTFQNIKLPVVKDDPREQPASDICELKNGNLLISSTFSGLWEFDPEALTFKDLSEKYPSKKRKSPSCVLCDQNGEVWFGGVGEGFRYDPVSGETKVFEHDDNDPASIPIPTIIDTYQDKAQSMWFHVIGEGISVTHTIDNPFKTIAEFGMSQALHLDDQLVLMNTREGLKVFDIEQEQFVETDIPAWFSNMRGRSLALSADKNILHLRNPNTDEIYRYDLTTKQNTLLPLKGWLKNDLKSTPWIKLNYFDDKQNKWINLRPELDAAFPDLTNNRIFGDEVFFNDKKSIWIRTKKGVLYYNLETKQGKHHLFYPKNPTASIEIYFIFPGSEGRFYCYATNGLSIYNPETESFKHYGERNGLLHNQAQAIIEDADKNLWIGSPKGLQKLDLKTGVFTNYDTNDGLPTETILYQSPFRDSLGFLYFSIAEKVIRFHPDSLPKKDYAPPVHLLDFYLNHKPVESIGKDSTLPLQLRFCNEVKLNYLDSDFGFSFVMPSFYKAEETTYFYQLHPYEEDWQSATTNTQIHYTNIDPGTYTFRVKAKTAAGFWSPNEAVVEVHISPPWWKTIWAYLAYILLFFGGTYSVYRFNLHRQLEKREAKRLTELDALKSRLYTNITHEFRTPLTVIMGMTSNIEGHSQEKKLITRNSKNLLRLINQLLDLSKLDSGTLKMNKIQADIVNYLQYLTESFYSMAVEKKIRLTFYPEVKELIMNYDETKIQHIIYNLLTNAIKFTPEGGKIILHLKEVETQGLAWLQIKVSDTGIGISEENLPNIFDRFYQGDSSATRKETGTGIGLSLTKELVEMMDGRIVVESKLGAGTDFMILLPIKKDSETVKQDKDGNRLYPTYIEPSTPLQSSEKPVPSLDLNILEKDPKTPSLLIIEDNRDVATYIESLLKKDYHIEIARDGQEGIDEAFQTIPDIIISDVMMPEKDGYEVCQTLKSDERTSHIPIILLTAKATTEDRIEGLKGGADAYLTKPFNKEELFIRLEKLIGLRKNLQKRYSETIGILKSEKSKTEPTLEDIFLQKLIKVVQDRIDDSDLAVVHLCRAAKLSNTQVNRKLKALTGKTPSQFIRSIRLQKAMELLKTTDLNISEIAYEVGFSDPNYFSRSFSEEFGYPPNVLRK